MVMHYSVGGDVACGRDNHYLTATPQRERVTCRSCLRSERFTSSAATLVPSRSEDIPPAAYSWRREWAEKALIERPADRLPRGVKRAFDLR